MYSNFTRTTTSRDGQQLHAMDKTNGSETCKGSYRCFVQHMLLQALDKSKTVNFGLTAVHNFLYLVTPYAYFFVDDHEYYWLPSFPSE